MRPKLFTFCVVLLLLVLGALRFYFTEKSFTDSLEIITKVWRPSETYVVTIDEIRRHSPAGSVFVGKLDSGENIYLKTQYSPNITLGDKLAIRGKPQFVNDPKLQSLTSYFKLKNIVIMIENPRISFCAENEINLVHFFLNFRDKITSYISSLFSYDVGGFLSGILLGDDDLLSNKTKDQFRIAGLTHVMAISGSNMTMIAEVVFLLLAFLPLRRKIILTILILTVFTLLVGASAAVLRAYFMSIIALFALHVGLPYLAMRALGFVIVVAFFFDPYIVIFDIGFQLSVMATLGLLVLNPLLMKLFSFFPWKWLKEIVTITLSASIFTLPISLHYFGTWFPLSLIINFFLVPIISSLSLLTYAGLLLTVIPVVGEVVRLLLELLFRCLLLLVDIASSVSGLLYIDISFPWFFVLLYYGVIFALIHFLQKKDRGKISRVNILPHGLLASI